VSWQFQPTWDSWEIKWWQDSSVARNLPITVTSEGASSYGIAPQKASSSSKCMEEDTSSGIISQEASKSIKPMEEGYLL
jgi:hypothetical protein